MGELRDRMVRDMDVRHFSGRTVEAYLAGVKGLAKYYRRAPDQLSDDEVQRYLLHLHEERQLSSSSCNQIRCALKFFYEVTVRRPQPSLTVPPMRQAQKLPEILSREEVERIVAATRTRRERVLLMATYGGGLRVSEVGALRPTDLDAERGVIRVEQGKGRKDRDTVLAERLVGEVAQYYAVYGRPEHWVFPQRADATRHLDASSAQKIYTTAKRRAGVEKVGGIHAMRHYPDRRIIPRRQQGPLLTLSRAGGSRVRTHTGRGIITSSPGRSGARRRAGSVPVLARRGRCARGLSPSGVDRRAGRLG